MARRRSERREDDAPWKRRRPPVAAAGEKAADAADGEREQPGRDEHVEQLARRPARRPRDDERRGKPRRDAARGREPAGPERAVSPVEEREERVPAGEGRRGDGGHGDQDRRQLARAPDGEERARTDAEHDGEAVQGDGDLGAAEDDAKRGEHIAKSKRRAGRDAAGGAISKASAETVDSRTYHTPRNGSTLSHLGSSHVPPPPRRHTVRSQALAVRSGTHLAPGACRGGCPWGSVRHMRVVPRCASGAGISSMGFSIWRCDSSSATRPWSRSAIGTDWSSA